MNPASVSSISFDLATLRAGYLSGTLTVDAVLAAAYDRIEREPRAGIWISRHCRAAAQSTAAALRERDPRTLPLYGIPFAVKDNIDVAGFPTTAACPAFARQAAESAPVVRRLLDAGAICLGKTNMDQFAAGLVGTRSPYGACHNAFDPNFISGGSSSGSAVAVALGQVAFALGTDTAGSGRVPAAFNNLVGYKPTRGLLSTRGVVPACRSLDCVSIFSMTVADALQLARVSAHYDPQSFAPRTPTALASTRKAGAPRPRCGIPQRGQLVFFGNAEYERLFAAAVERVARCGAELVEIDFTPFQSAAEFLYGGPWIAERYAAIKPFFDQHAQELFPVTRMIVERGRQVGGAAVFDGLARLDTLRTQAEAEWRKMDFLLLPTAGTTYRIAEVEANPLELNSRLGHYTNFVNLLDCAALALPAGFGADGLPFGITLVSPAEQDLALFDFGAALQTALNGPLGATGKPMPEVAQVSPPSAPEPLTVQLAVVGAHLSGQPLNHELTRRNARLVESCRTAPIYRLYALATTPPKPGLIQVAAGEGASIELEIWELSVEAFGSFVAHVPPPMAIGTLRLESGAQVKGFLCEPLATQGARDISVQGGWRAYLSNVRESAT
jgi:allophanate hydrolase